MGVGAAIGGVVGSLIAGNAAKKAASTQAASASSAIEEQRRQFDISRKDMMPWLQAGQQALADLQGELGSSYEESEGYKFAVEEGEKSALSNLAALGMTNSGSALKKLTEFRMGLAAQDYGTWYNRKAALAGQGQTQSTALGSLGSNYAGNVGNLLLNRGQAQASGIVGQANALGSGLQQAFGGLGYLSGGGAGGAALSPLNYSQYLSGAGGLY